LPIDPDRPAAWSWWVEFKIKYNQRLEIAKTNLEFHVLKTP